ncbi:MAG TPA: response regulator transcription factor [Elusimicrobiota bacterium]|nr:response regulator transcription factor [Elusimicrobiota bacterium]
MMRVLIADDHAMFRDGLKKVLAGCSDITVAGEAGDPPDVLEMVRRLELDAVLLDIGMPGRDGIDVLKEIKRLKPGLAVLIVSMYPEDQYAVRAIKAGAAGYITKNKAAREVIDALRRAALGKRYISPDVAEQLAVELDRPESDAPLYKRLSDREYQVMCMIASGKTVKQIAAELSLSVSTISTNRARILVKMELRNNAEITRYALQNHLVP